MNHDASQDAPPTFIIKAHAKNKHWGSQGFVLQESHGSV
jgi:hypothetical protein